MTDREIAEGVNVNPERMGGEPCIIGTRIPPRCVSSLAKAGYSVSRIIAEYPDLSPKQVADALAFEARPASEKRLLSRCIPAEVWMREPSVGH